MQQIGTIISGSEHILPTGMNAADGYRLDFREWASWSAFSISKIEVIGG